MIPWDKLYFLTRGLVIRGAVRWLRPAAGAVMRASGSSKNLLKSRPYYCILLSCLACGEPTSKLFSAAQFLLDKIRGCAIKTKF